MDDFSERLRDTLSNAYDIERELGGGGMSRVFVATDKLLGRKIVIKLLSPELLESVNRARFRREIQVAAQLQHPHIVTLLSAGEHGDLVYYTMPFIDGESLKSALEKHGQLPVRDVIRVLYDVVDALGYAHARGVIHRDIKPANILRSGAHSLVTDFGVAKALNAAMASTAMTSTGMAIGTPAYMAPEQLAGDPSADHRIDVYAVGLLAYELLSGQSPFAGPSPQAVMAALLTRDPTPLKDVRKDVPLRLSEIIMQCLEKDPDQRPPDADSLMSALDMIATASGEIRTREHRVPTREYTVPAAIPIVEETAFVQEIGGKRSRSRFLLPVLALLILAPIIGYLLWSRFWEKPAVATAQAPKSASSADPALAPSPQAVTANSGAIPAAVAPVSAPLDSLAIADIVRRQIAEAAAVKTPGRAPVNIDSLRRRLQRDVTDSIARANARAAAAAPVAAPVAPSVMPAAPTTTAAAAPSGKRRLALGEPREIKDQPALNAFSRALIDALRRSLEDGDAFVLVDQDSVRRVLARTQSRDEAVRILQPDVLVSPSYVGTGDTVNIIVTVRDLRSSSGFGIRVTSTKLMPAHPELYLGPIVQSVLKQLDDLSRAPTIYRR